MNLFKILSWTRKSKRVGKECCICGKSINYLFFPEDMNERFELDCYSDITHANVCECGAIRHICCSSAKQRKHDEEHLSKGVGTFGQILQKEMRREKPNLDSITEALTRDTAALGCPKCGSFKSTVALVTDNDTIITLRQGKRI